MNILFADKGEIWQRVQDMHATIHCVQMVPRGKDAI